MLEARLLCYEQRDEVLAAVAASEGDVDAAQALSARFGITPENARRGILDLRVSGLTAARRRMVERELNELRERLA
jgi:DNA gyrase/topoisomerase IV subunit A